MKDIVEIHKALGDETRLRILRLLLFSKKELCSCELVDSLEERQYNVSRHLKILKKAGLVDEREEGRWVYSFIAAKPDAHTKGLFKAILHIPETARLHKDAENMNRRLAMRENGKCLKGIQNLKLAGRES